jgi:transcriptional regulator with XRE-family HTH domain
VTTLSDARLIEDIVTEAHKVDSRPAPQPNRVSAYEAAFGVRLRQMREALCLSQRGLAERLSEHGLVLDASAITRIEKGQRAIRLGEAPVFADAFSLRLTDLLGEGDDDHAWLTYSDRVQAFGHLVLGALADAGRLDRDADLPDGEAWLEPASPQPGRAS